MISLFWLAGGICCGSRSKENGNHIEMKTEVTVDDDNFVVWAV